MRMCRTHKCRAFTLVELLVVISIIALLLSILLPSLSKVRSQAQRTMCLTNLRQLGLAVELYQGDYKGYFPPAYESLTDTHWWGQKLADGIDSSKGFSWPYLSSRLDKRSVYECPSQRFGTYRLQGKPPGEADNPKWITSTYGYNGYYLTPGKTAGWAMQIGQRSWQRNTTIIKSASVIVFADTMLDRDSTGTQPDIENCALLDPPFLFNGSSWDKNDYPTTSFRHNDRTNALLGDGHCQALTLQGGSYVRPKSKMGSVGTNNDNYVPDWRLWQTSRKSR